MWLLECEDADRLDGGPTHSHRPHNTHTHTDIALHSRGTLLRNLPEDKSSPHFKGYDRTRLSECAS